MAFGSASSVGVRSDINITPLVDVVLVLLIIFMVMTPMLLKEINLTVPEKSETTIVAPTPASQVVVSLSREGTIQINHEPIAESLCKEKIHDIMAARADKLVFFHIDDEAPYGDAMHVMDVCRGAGVKTLGIVDHESSV